MFRILGQQTGSFLIATPDGNQPVNYDLATRRLSFQTLDLIEDMNNPLFCFDFSGTGGSTQLRLDVSNSSAQPALVSVPVASAVQYRLSGGSIDFSPGSQTQCFYIGDGEEPNFGLFGALPPPPPEPEDPEPDPEVVFQDTFEINIDPRLDIRFVGVPQSVTAGGSLSYSMVVENTGELDLTGVAFQEVFPANINVFPAALEAGSWTCAGTGADCPAASGNGLIRFTGASLPVGGVLEFQITRPVIAASTGGAQIDLYAGIVSGPGSAAAFSVDQAAISVIGAPVALAFSSASNSVVLGDVTELVVRVVDAGGNRVFGDSRTIRVEKVGSSGPGDVGGFSAFQAVNDGEARFEVTGTISGSLQLIATNVIGSPPVSPAITIVTVTPPLP